MNEDVAAASEGGDGVATALLSSYLPSYPDRVRLKLLESRIFIYFTGKWDPAKERRKVWKISSNFIDLIVELIEYNT